MISPQAYIAPGAKIGERVKIYPFAYIEDDVVVGDDCTIYPHVSLMNGTRIGQGNTIYQNAVLGASPQDFTWQGEPSTLIVGDRNVIRENVVISRASRRDIATQIGSENILMEGTHISHNCLIGDRNVFGYAVKIACDCTIGSKAIFSSNVTAKPQCRIGDLAFILTGCRFGEDIPPYITVKDNPAVYAGIHAGMLSKAGASTSVPSVTLPWPTASSSTGRSVSTTPSFRSRSRYPTALRFATSSSSSAPRSPSS